jgi:hypothetical protein
MYCALFVFALWMIGYCLGLITYHIVWSKRHADSWWA